MIWSYTIQHQQYEYACRVPNMYREVKKKFVKLKFSLVLHEIVVKYRNKAIPPKKKILPSAVLFWHMRQQYERGCAKIWWHCLQSRGKKNSWNIKRINQFHEKFVGLWFETKKQHQQYDRVSFVAPNAYHKNDFPPL